MTIGTDVQAFDAQLADVAGLATTDGGIIVGDGSNFVLETGATARTSLGLGTGDSPEFTGVQLANDTWLTGANQADDGTVNIIKVNTDNELEIGGTLNIGTLELAEDSGAVTMVNMPVTSGAADGTAESYTFALDSESIFTIDADSDGAGGIDTKGAVLGENVALKWLEDSVNGSNFLAFSAPDALAGDVTWTLPSTDSTGTQALVSDGAGALSWTSVQASDAELDAIAALAVTDGNIIVGNGTTWVAETGATARTSLGVAIGSDVQAWDNDLDDLAALAQADGNIIVSDGTDWIVESGATARTSLGVGAADSVTFANTTLGTGGAIRTSTSDTNTALIQAYDVDGVAYTTFGTLTAGNTPTFDLDPTSLAIGGGSAMTAILDEDDLTSDSATALATQQSIKAYVDTAVSGGSALIVDADADTQIQVEEGADDDTIRFDAAGTEVVTIVAATTTVGNDLDLDIAQDVIDFSLEEETAKGTCTTANSGQVTYETAANVGTFYGCSQTGASSYAWVQLQVFQQ